MDYRTRSPLRLLAPVALVAFGLVFLVVIFTSSGGDESADPGSAAQEQRPRDEQATGEGATDEAGPKRYTVQSGDTLGSISQRTGVDVETLQELNPDLDPQALVAGQRIKLRE